MCGLLYELRCVASCITQTMVPQGQGKQDHPGLVHVTEIKGREIHVES